MSGLKVVDLKDLVIPEALVPIGDGQAIRVFGLNMEELVRCFSEHIEVLDNLLNGAIDDDFVQFMQNDMPDTVAEILAVATRDPDTQAAKGIIRTLPSQTQMIGLYKVLTLTFPDEDLMGKFWAGLEKYITKLKAGHKAAMATE